MRTPYLLVSAILLTAPAMLAQQWELGALGGFGITRGVSVRNITGSVTTGLKSGPAFGAVGGSNDYRYLGGEASYVYRQGDLKLRGLGRNVAFGGHTQFFDFRLLIHFADRQARIRPFVALGGGVVVYSGTGVENASQPLNSFVGLTHTNETKPMVSGAAGVKVRLARHWGLRFEFRDYSSPFPDKVIAIAPRVSASGWLHNFVPVGGIIGLF